jgi:L-serine dehydratase
VLSVVDIFKIGIGPSSSHTVGPMLIAKRFLDEARGAGALDRIARLKVELYGSLGHTGRGHGTDRAIALGLMGAEPETVELDCAELSLHGVKKQGRLPLLGGREVAFSLEGDIVYRGDIVLPAHPNGMLLQAFDQNGEGIFAQIYFSIGGGAIRRDDEIGQERADCSVNGAPYPFATADALLVHGYRTGLSIADIVLANEARRRSETETFSYLDRIWDVMASSIARGLCSEGVLPGGLGVRRRAPRLFGRLAAVGPAQTDEREALFDWFNVYAIAVNEENAAGGRVVTAPTNGAAGIIPAVIRHYCATPDADREHVRRFLLTAGAIGMLYKSNASVSGAEMGCQGEVGVASSMAAAGLAAVWGASNAQIEHAAEIAMEHHLGLTCDPVRGLVQIPCIERNAFGAVKAVNAARLALSSTGDHKVSLDQVIETMRQTGLDMNAKYKETSQGGLAVNVVEC